MQTLSFTIENKTFHLHSFALLFQITQTYFCNLKLFLVFFK